MDLYRQAMAEREKYHDRLEEAGYEVNGGGVSMVNFEWDIFITDPSDPNGEVTLHGPKEAEQWLDDETTG